MDALDMGGYGSYVWTSVGLTVTVLIVCTVQAFLRHRKVLREVTTTLRAREVQS